MIQENWKIFLEAKKAALMLLECVSRCCFAHVLTAVMALGVTGSALALGEYSHTQKTSYICWCFTLCRTAVFKPYLRMQPLIFH